MKNEETPVYFTETHGMSCMEGYVDHNSADFSEHGSQKNVSFRYTGKRTLAMRGLVSGKKYYFDQPGIVIEIDHRDLVFFEDVPNLEKLQPPR